MFNLVPLRGDMGSHGCGGGLEPIGLEVRGLVPIYPEEPSQPVAVTWVCENTDRNRTYDCDPFHLILNLTKWVLTNLKAGILNALGAARCRVRNHERHN